MMAMFKTISVAASVLMLAMPALALDVDAVNNSVSDIEQKVITWRRDIHQHPELGNNEYRTAKLVAKQLKFLGLEVTTKVGKTGVVAILRGGKPGPVLALRADMDALPIKENTGRSFASKVKAKYGGETVSVMHACGHDAHTAILLGAATVLAEMKDDVHGTIMFVFQPAEEGPPPGETGGASRMLDEGLFDTIKPEAIFGLHVEPGPVGRIYARPGPFLASATVVNIDLQGRGTHAARPWMGTDLVNLSADIIKVMNIIEARRVNKLSSPTVITLASVSAGRRSNVLPAEAKMSGTIRVFTEERLAQVQKEIHKSVQSLSENYGATAKVTFSDSTPPTGSDPALLSIVSPALAEAAGDAGFDMNASLRPAAEDFAFYEQKIPGVYYILGSTPNFTSFENAPGNHSPEFDIDEAVLSVGVKAHVLSALTYLEEKAKTDATK